ncbi:MAG: lytic transglycosylase domain-containing protein [Chitinophagaceae bacterium]
MKRRILLVYISLNLLCVHVSVSTAWARDITFCGEQIPINNSFVANKLMNVIRQQIRYVNLPRLRSEAKTYFPIIEYYLKSAGMPQDLKYIPIIESGFRNATSPVGAQGFWQLMKPTAEEWGLKVNASRDERNDIYKATIAALKELARNYNMIRRHHNISSWVLTAASYNYGTGRLYKKIRTEGKNYFTMNLNPETALYVYKIMAIKELFEYPELYIKNFQYNVFNQNAVKRNQQDLASDEKADFQNIEMKVNEDGKAAPDGATIENLAKPDEADLKTKDEETFRKSARLVGAQIISKHKSFKDGDEITIELQENLQTLSGFQRKGTPITGKGWIIDGDRVHIDLRFNSNNVILYDTNSEQGISRSSLKKGEQVILRVQN